ncbi:MAG: hypothetical protein EXR07_09040 [Acetobacteraceae bacterium]|nr:hypothetical protein [Acetobacteraceae bacterium]
MLVFLTAQSGPGPGTAPSTDREATARGQVEDAERVRAAEAETQREAIANLARALADEKRLTVAQAAAFERLKRAETAVNDVSAYMLTLEQARAEAQARIDKREALLLRLIPVMLRMSEHPLETLLSSPLSPEDTVRGLIIIRYLARQAVAEGGALAEDRAALEAASRATAEAAPRLAAAKAARAHEADVLGRQLAATRAQREAAEQEAALAARRVAAEAARAKNLRDMLQILETQRRLEDVRAREDVLRAERDQKVIALEAARLRQAAMGRPAGAGTLAADAKPSGQLTMPVAGSLLRGWGDPEDGEPATGQSWQTEPGAQVVAPCGGTIAFAEPFRGYGLLVIIDCGGGYHAVLSGMDQIAVAPGRPIHSGDSIGTMRAAVETAGSDPAAVGPPVLYLELRKGGRPVNPAPWVRAPG